VAGRNNRKEGVELEEGRIDVTAANDDCTKIVTKEHVT
jgi:hypothetical protein